MQLRRVVVAGAVGIMMSAGTAATVFAATKAENKGPNSSAPASPATANQNMHGNGNMNGDGNMNGKGKMNGNGNMNGNGKAKMPGMPMTGVPAEG